MFPGGHRSRRRRLRRSPFLCWGGCAPAVFVSTHPNRVGGKSNSIDVARRLIRGPLTGTRIAAAGGFHYVSLILALERSDHGNDSSNGPGDVSRTGHQGGRPAVHGLSRASGSTSRFPVDKLDEEVFEDGLGFDGSSIRGWQAINESDMLLVPQPDTAFVDPFTVIPTLCMICNMQDPITREDYTPRPAQRRPQGGELSEEHRRGRHVLHRPRGRVLHLRRRALRPDAATSGYYYIDSDEGEWNRGTDTRQGQDEPGLQAAPQGRLLPGAAGRPADGHPQRDDADDDRVRPRRRSPAPRSGHRRPVGNRPASSPTW